ncbi:MAG TPA: phage late control D family protein, partial [Polyangiaceae bacterium]
MPLVTLTCAVGSPFEVRRFKIHEGISDVFRVEAEVTATDPNVDLEAIIGREAGLELQSGYAHATKGQRVWTGICNHIQQVQGVTTGLGTIAVSTYLVSIVPILWMLTQRTNHRIFQRLSIPDIVDKVFQEWKVQAEWKINREAYPKLEFKVQYGETDFDFVNRLLEEAGIAFTTDAEQNCAVVLSDDFNIHPLREHPPLPFEDNPTESAQIEFITKLSSHHDVRPGGYQFVD